MLHNRSECAGNLAHWKLPGWVVSLKSDYTNPSDVLGEEYLVWKQIYLVLRIGTELKDNSENFCHVYLKCFEQPNRKEKR